MLGMWAMAATLLWACGHEAPAVHSGGMALVEMERRPEAGPLLFSWGTEAYYGDKDRFFQLDLVKGPIERSDLTMGLPAYESRLVELVGDPGGTSYALMYLLDETSGGAVALMRRDGASPSPRWEATPHVTDSSAMIFQGPDGEWFEGPAVRNLNGSGEGPRHPDWTENGSFVDFLLLTSPEPELIALEMPESGSGKTHARHWRTSSVRVQELPGLEASFGLARLAGNGSDAAAYGMRYLALYHEGKWRQISLNERMGGLQWVGITGEGRVFAVSWAVGSGLPQLWSLDATDQWRWLLDFPKECSPSDPVASQSQLWVTANCVDGSFRLFRTRDSPP